MNISYNWLKSYIDFNYSPEELSALLTGCGLEVESIEQFESVRGGLNGLIVGEVLDTAKHPNADRLTVCKVDTGNNNVSQIVCGAPNVAKGQKVIVAVPGTTIYPVSGEPFQIKKSKIRGEESDGMICAEDEIGLGTSHEGILILDPSAATGTPVAALFNIENDHTLSIGLTPNRPDAASHIGVARDLKAVMNTRAPGTNDNLTEIRYPDVTSVSIPESQPKISVVLEDKACYRYSGLHIKNIKTGPSPDWLQTRLRSIGLTPINNIVDITNFVLFEYGQPLHAFDAGKIHNNKIIVKRLPAGTEFVTLDGVTRKLNGTEMMICDDNGGLCIAGVFGGVGSGVSDSTTEVFLESAWFDSVSIRRTSSLHGLKTDASFRFERGTDPDITVTALKRAAQMICELAGGEISSGLVDEYPDPVKPVVVNYRFSSFKNLTGVTIAEPGFEKILVWLDIKVNSKDGDIMELSVPPYRVDVTREADVTEEVLRIYGYDRIPLPQKMNISLPVPVKRNDVNLTARIASMLTADGFTEVMSNSLYRSSAYHESETGFVKIANPLSQELDTLRINMLYPLLDVLQYNRNRKRGNLRVFEFGKTYFKPSDEKYIETDHLALLLSGKRTEAHWSTPQSGYSLFYLKSVIENLVHLLCHDAGHLKWSESESNFLSGSVELKVKKKLIATAGTVGRKVLKEFDLDGEVWYADIQLENLLTLSGSGQVQMQPPPKFPEVVRDLSLLIDKNVQYQSLETLAFETERSLLKSVNLFDVYEGDKIEAGKKSYALSFLLRDESKTLTDKEIDKVMNRLMDAYEKKLGAVVRKA